MHEKLQIINSCKISRQKVWLNDKIIYDNSSEVVDLPVFLKNVYKNFETAYPKYFKMDLLSKLGFLCADILLNNTPEIKNNHTKEMAIILANRNASLDTDTKYHQTVKDPENYFPSPALFVYTLPNIVIGEIAIKHKITGENSFFVFEKPDMAFIRNYVSVLFENKTSNAALWGWVDVLKKDYEAVINYSVR